jgi:hypothetical protein
LGSLTKLPDVEVDKLVSHAELRSRLADKADGGAVVILSAVDKSELAQAITWVSENREAVKNGIIRPLSFVKLADPRLLALMRKQGLSEVIEVTASTKELMFKVNKSVQAIGLALSKRKAAFGDRTADSRGASGAQAARKAAGEVKVEWTAALTLAADTWLIDKAQVRVVMGRWLIEVTGPGPAAGNWEPAGSGTRWVWKPRDPAHDRFTSTGLGDQGAWLLSGRQPEFVWAINRWRIVGTDPALGFERAGQATIYRYQFKDGVLRVAENSNVALGKKATMQATFEASLRLKNDKKPAAGEDARFKDEASKPPGWNENLTPDAEAAAWNNGANTRDADPAAWNNGVNSADPAAAAFNDGSHTADPTSPEWGGTDVGRGNRFESGRGLGQGQGGSGPQGYGYESEPDTGGTSTAFKTGDAAFSRLEIEVQLMLAGGPPEKCTLLDREGNRLTLEVPSHAFVAKQALPFRLVLTGGPRRVELSFACDFDSEEVYEDGAPAGLMIAVVSIHPENFGQIDGIFREYDKWQSEALVFLKSARGL